MKFTDIYPTSVGLWYDMFLYSSLMFNYEYSFFHIIFQTRTAVMPVDQDSQNYMHKYVWDIT